MIRDKVINMLLGHKSLFILLTTLSTLSFTLGESEKKLVSFHKEIKPIFQANCNGCHQPAKMKGDYLIT